LEFFSRANGEARNKEQTERKTRRKLSHNTTIEETYKKHSDHEVDAIRSADDYHLQNRKRENNWRQTLKLLPRANGQPRKKEQIERKTDKVKQKMRSAASRRSTRFVAPMTIICRIEKENMSLTYSRLLPSCERPTPIQIRRRKLDIHK